MKYMSVFLMLFAVILCASGIICGVTTNLSLFYDALFIISGICTASFTNIIMLGNI